MFVVQVNMICLLEMMYQLVYLNVRYMYFLQLNFDIYMIMVLDIYMYYFFLIEQSVKIIFFLEDLIKGKVYSFYI